MVGASAVQGSSSMQGSTVTACLALLLSALVLAPTSVAAATAEPAGAHYTPKGHAHVPRIDPAEQKLQSLLQEPGGPAKAKAIQPPAVAALLPACVPKYVTDLVIPPPMPVSVVPLSKVGP